MDEKTYEWYKYGDTYDPTYIFISEFIMGHHLTYDFIHKNKALKNYTNVLK